VVTQEEEMKKSPKRNRLARSSGWLAWVLLALSLPVLSIGITLWFTGPAWFYYRETDIVRKISILLLIAGPAIFLTGLTALYISRLLRPKRAPQVNLNRATLKELQALPGVGIIRATAILEYRQQKGPFRVMADLVKVPGVGWTTLEGLRDMVNLES
jgi:competence protein ComEA